jgi:S1-C subfamily serine protease
MEDFQAVIRFLSGNRRGQLTLLTEKTYFMLDAGEGEARIEVPDGWSEEDCIAVLHRHGGSYEVEATRKYPLWLNGERVEGHHALRSGDLLELGHAGNVVRFRVYPPGVAPHQTLSDALRDSLDSAKADKGSGANSFARFCTTLTYDIATRTSVWFRVWILLLITIIVLAIGFLVFSDYRFQHEVSRELMRLDNLARILQESDSTRLAREDLEQLRSDLAERMGKTLERVRDLEARSDAFGKVIRDATPSVAIIQGQYGFRSTESGELLRFLVLPEGILFFTGEEEGDVVQVNFAGTAFVISESGLLLTNKHVALPWLTESQDVIPTDGNLEPYVIRMRAFLPDHSSAFGTKLLEADEALDLAFLEVQPGGKTLQELELSPDPPSIGDEVLVMGYPLGVEGIIARAGMDATEQIRESTDLDYWKVMDLLADSGDIKPLSTRGIVSQYSTKTVAYDAETTVGGSGGPVLDVNGRVIAINTSVMEGFGGSNLGVPAALARALLKRQHER